MSSAGLPILMYHGVDILSSVITVPPDEFAWQMGWLHAHGYKSITLGDVSRCMTAGMVFPADSFVLTFDDGYRSVYTDVFPVLQRYGFSATVFLVAGYCGRENDWPGQPPMIPKLRLLDWDQIHEMARHGIEFGAHTSTHPRLDRLPVSSLQDEIVLSKAALENRLGRPVDVFAYPYGRYGNHAKEMVKQTYAGACSTHLGFIRPDSDRYALERLEIKYLSSPWVFRRLFHSLFPHYLSLRSAGRAVRSAIFPTAWM